MNGDARLTEERLRSWLDANQPARERLCIQILSLDRRFKDVRPRQPKGGPDGGLDIEASFEDGSRVIGAIGFRNSPSDSTADQRWVRAKFKSDFAAAKASAGAVEVFVFMTNVRLTVGMRAKLLELGRSLGARSVEIFDREQMRVVLDGPEGLAARYQFLQIPLSEAEQSAFFSRWGADLERLVASSFAAVEERLRRLEFLHEKEQLLSSLSFYVTLREHTAIAELPHVRVVLFLAKFTQNVERSQWHVGVCNNAPIRNASGCGAGPCLAGAFWLDDPAKLHTSSASTWPDPFAGIAGGGGFSEFTEPQVAAKLSDLDEGFFAFFMNQRLFEHVTAVRLYANQYLIWSATADQLRADPPSKTPVTPWVFSEDELADAWVRVMAKGGTGTIHFSSVTPRRMWDAPRLSVGE
jgi:hypothetical protein